MLDTQSSHVINDLVTSIRPVANGHLPSAAWTDLHWTLEELWPLALYTKLTIRQTSVSINQLTHTYFKMCRSVYKKFCSPKLHPTAVPLFSVWSIILLQLLVERLAHGAFDNIMESGIFFMIFFGCDSLIHNFWTGMHTHKTNKQCNHEWEDFWQDFVELCMFSIAVRGDDFQFCFMLVMLNICTMLLCN